MPKHPLKNRCSTPSRSTYCTARNRTRAWAIVRRTSSLQLREPSRLRWGNLSVQAEVAMAVPHTRVSYKSPLQQMTQTTPTRLWNDSASIEELTYSMEHGAVGATCNPVIAVTVLKKEMATW